jgi:hypothetical protein
MRCAADHGGLGAPGRPPAAAPQPGRLTVGLPRRQPGPPGALGLVAACLLAACLLAACSAGKPAGSGPSSGGIVSRGGGISGKGPVGRQVINGPAGGPGGPGGLRNAIMIGGPGGGGFLIVPGISGSSAGRPSITVPRIPPASSAQPVNLPLSTYADVAIAQQSALADANTLLTQKCMAAKGFSYSATTTPSAEEAIVQDTEYGYGVSSLAAAGAYGYGQPGSGAGPGPGPAFLGGFASFGDLAQQPRAWTVALLGFAPGARIGKNQTEGCLQLAGTLLYGNRGGPSDPVPSIAVQASQWTQSDPRVLAVDAAWSRCMAARGYKYSNPQQAAGAHWPSTPTPRETAIAVADVTCKQQVNLVNTWLTVEAAYQAVLVAKDLATLSQLQASFRNILQRAENLLTIPVLPAARPLRLGRGRPGQSVRISIQPPP